MKNSVADNIASVDSSWQPLKDWIKQEPTRLKRFLIRLAESFGTHLSLEFRTMLDTSDYVGLANLSFNPLEVDASVSTLSLINDYFLTEVLSKQAIWDIPGVSEVRDVRTLEKFFQVEQHCASVNQRYSHLDVLPFRKAVESCIFSMQRKIANFCDIDWDGQARFYGWGPGSTTSIKGRYTHANKLGEYPFCINVEAWKLHSNLVSKFPGYLRALLVHNFPDMDPHQFVGEFCPLIDNYVFNDVDELCLVPKTAKSDRTITVSTTAQVFTTLSYGEVMRDRLISFYNVDLRKQQRNQELAADYANCTIDLSSASDSISLGLIAHLFPTSMSEMLFCLRSRKFQSPGQEGSAHIFSKFAGMGNGLTFPLETLIFHSAAMSVCEFLGLATHDVSTYGDDIIVPCAAYDLLSEVLRNLGFTLNAKKSNSGSSVLRESCGAHYIRGEDAKPAYVKRAGYDFETCIRNHNRFLRYFIRTKQYHLVPLLGILRWDCPVYCYAETGLDLSVPIGHGVLQTIVVPEEDHAFYVSFLPKMKEQLYRYGVRPQYCKTVPFEAMWLKHFDMHKQSSPVLLCKRRCKNERWLKTVNRHFALADKAKPREFLQIHKGKHVLIECKR